MADSSGRLVWIDCEMTGLDIERDALIEVAALVTDAELNVLGDGVDVRHHARRPTLDQMGDFVREMHTSLRPARRPRRAASRWPRPRSRCSTTCARSSPEPRRRRSPATRSRTDRTFLARDMPELDDAPALPDRRRLQHQGARPPVVPAVYYARPRRTATTARWPTSRTASTSSATTARGLRAAARPGHRGARSAAADVRRRTTDSPGRAPTPIVRAAEVARAAGPDDHTRLAGGGSSPAGRYGGCSSAGRAPRCGRGCRGFKSRHSPHAPLRRTPDRTAIGPDPPRVRPDLLSETDRSTPARQHRSDRTWTRAQDGSTGPSIGDHSADRSCAPAVNALPAGCGAGRMQPHPQCRRRVSCVAACSGPSARRAGPGSDRSHPTGSPRTPSSPRRGCSSRTARPRRPAP